MFVQHKGLSPISQSLSPPLSTDSSVDRHSSGASTDSTRTLKVVDNAVHSENTHLLLAFKMWQRAELLVMRGKYKREI